MAVPMRTRYQKLRVYILSEKLSDSIWEVVAEWKTFERSTIGGQLVRAADSIGANLAEGAGRGTTKDNCRFIRIARGSLHETQHWLRRAYFRKLLKEEEIAELKMILDELAPKLNAYLNSISKRPFTKPDKPSQDIVLE